MAQIEFAGIKFTGGKMALVITLVTSLIGGLWGGFEVYKYYMDMKEKIQSYTAPDLSGLDKRIAKGSSQGKRPNTSTMNKHKRRQTGVKIYKGQGR